MTNDKCNVIYTHSRNFVSSVVMIDWVGWYEWNSQMQQCIKIWYMVFGGSDFDSLLHIILVVFMFGGSNQTFGKSQCYCVSTKHIFRFQPIWHYGVSVRPCYCVSFDYSVGLCCKPMSLGGGAFSKILVVRAFSHVMVIGHQVFALEKCQF